MKKLWLLALLLLLSGLVLAANPLEMDSVKASVKLSNIIEIKPQTNNYVVDYVTADLSWVPRDTYRQEVQSIVTEPKSEEVGDELNFRWDYPKERDLWVKVGSTVTSRADYFEVSKKVKFPLQNLDSELAYYFKEQEIIDFNPEIRELAAELAEGKDDLYEVVVAIGDWVNSNIEYSLDTITADASQKSSWVLENRRGVCDELTSLFISMLRVLGVPARFVYGTSYTNTNDAWGPHGWAEVYFPDYGWVPFDPTYAEYGYVDAGHVKMGESADSRRPSMRYAVKARDANVESGFLDVNVDFIQEGNLVDAGLDLSSDFRHGEIGLASYNLLIVNVKNKDNFYKPVSLRLTSPKEISVEETSKIVLLKPKEEKTVHWIVNIGKTLDPNFLYSFPFIVRSDKGAVSEAVFKARNSATNYEKSLFENIVESETQEKVKEYSKNVDFICEPSSDAAYINQSITIHCVLKNKGGRTLKNSEICYLEECSTQIIDEEATFSFTDSFMKPGLKNFIISSENEDFRKTSYTRVNVIDESNLRIYLNAPTEVKYRENFEVRFSLNKTSVSVPQNINVRMELQNSYQEWNIKSLERPNDFKVTVDTAGLNFKNDFVIRAVFEDELGKKYSVEEEIRVKLVDLSLVDRIIVGLNTIGYKILELVS